MNSTFIQSPSVKMQYTDAVYSPAVRMRRHFQLDKVEPARLCVCGLGYGYFFLNGQAVSQDLLSAPVSDPLKTLWFHEYDVTDLLREGDNVLCIHLGNGFYNENFPTPWKHHQAPWRGVPKAAVELHCGSFHLEADEHFLTSADPAVFYNQLRIGEWYDAHKEEDWLSPAYDDGAWEPAILSPNAPTGTFRLCPAPPIRVLEEYPTVQVLENDLGYVFDIGQNLSGFIRLEIDEPAGTELVIEHAEQIDEANHLKLNELDLFYKPFQVDKVIASGQPLAWSPKFTYHGFRYVQIKGLTRKPSPQTVTGLFVHQNVENTATFHCDHPLFNRLYRAGILSTWSNMHYALTDCPHREKLGWTNDAAATAQQLCLHFDAHSFLDKWMQDYVDAVDDKGITYGIIPTPGDQYDLGPVCDAALYNLPYEHYLYYRDKRMLELVLPACERNFAYLFSQFELDREFGLKDWTGYGSKPTPHTLIYGVLLCQFIDKMQFMRRELGLGDSETLAHQREWIVDVLQQRFLIDGRCTVEEQTALAMLLCLGLGDRDKLGEQLEQVIREKCHSHLDVGMVGMQYLFKALTLTGRQDLAVELISQPTAPSYAVWFQDGATTLYENFAKGHTNSKNHHMFSCVLAWMTESILGLHVNEDGSITFAPATFRDIHEAQGSIRLMGKDVSVHIRDGVAEITVPEGLTVRHAGQSLPQGANQLTI